MTANPTQDFVNKMQSGYFQGQSSNDVAIEPYSSFYDIVSAESRKSETLKGKTLEELSKDKVFWKKCHDILKENQIIISRKRQKLRQLRQPELIKGLAAYFPEVPEDKLLDVMERARTLIRLGY